MKPAVTARILGLLFSLFLLTGCFEVVEDIHVHSDGTGKFHLMVNMSQSKAKLASIMLLDSIHGRKVPKVEEITKQLEEVKKLASQTPGISNVVVESDFKNFIFNFKCDFKNVESMNLFMDKISALYKLGKFMPPRHPHYQYDVQKHIFTRNGDYFKKISFSALKETEKNILEKGTFVSVYRFHHPIKSCSNKQSVLSPAGNAAMLKVPAANCVKSLSTITNIITLSH